MLQIVGRNIVLFFIPYRHGTRQTKIKRTHSGLAVVLVNNFPAFEGNGKIVPFSQEPSTGP
jgi:hypothetical protein